MKRRTTRLLTRLIVTLIFLGIIAFLLSLFIPEISAWFKQHLKTILSSVALIIIVAIGLSYLISKHRNILINYSALLLVIFSAGYLILTYLIPWGRRNILWIIGIVALIFAIIAFLLFKYPKFKQKIFSNLKEIFSKTSPNGKRTPIPKLLVEFVWKRARNKCQYFNCWERQFLEIHHIDGHNNHHTKSNLILLCAKHHKMAQNKAVPRHKLYRWRDGRYP